jgi:hypothetical protein
MTNASAELSSLLAAMVVASSSIARAAPLRSAIVVPVWLPFAAIATLGVASSIFGICCPEVIVACFGQF